MPAGRSVLRARRVDVCAVVLADGTVSRLGGRVCAVVLADGGDPTPWRRVCALVLEDGGVSTLWRRVRAVVLEDGARRAARLGQAWPYGPGTSSGPSSATLRTAS